MTATPSYNDRLSGFIRTGATVTQNRGFLPELMRAVEHITHAFVSYVGLQNMPDTEVISEIAEAIGHLSAATGTSPDLTTATAARLQTFTTLLREFESEFTAASDALKPVLVSHLSHAIARLGADLDSELFGIHSNAGTSH